MIHAPHWVASDYQDIPVPNTLTFRGELRLSELEEDSCKFLNILVSQVIRYEKITLKNCGFLDFHFLQQLISGVGATLRRLDIVALGDSKPPVSHLI